MSSTDASTSALLRWRPAVLGLTVIAGVLGIYYLRQTGEEWEDGSQRGLHRSNAIRRATPRLRHTRPDVSQAAMQENGEEADTRRGPEDQVMTERRESFAGTLDLPDDQTTVNAGDGSDGQSLLNMLYHIAVEQANREGYVHRGVTCNSCHAYPIRGIRYRCANCPDYDLCEQCESLGNIHDRTHLFYKIRIPAPFLGANPKQQQPVWYPGKPHANPRSVPNALKKRLSETTGFERSLIDALWDQFKTLAGCDWPDDPNGLCIAIDRDIWANYCISPLMKKHTTYMTLLFDRSFTFWDDNGDGLIGFEEFLQGLQVRQSKDRTESNRRTFRAHDLDGDGYVMRQDFLSLFIAHYAYCKEQIRDMAMFIEDEVLEGGQLKETLQSTQAVSSCFHGSIPQPDSPRGGEGKTVNSIGDLVVTDSDDTLQILSPEDDGLVHADDTDEAPVHQDNQSVFADIFESLSQSMPDWPPNFVTPEDAHKALGRRASLNAITEPGDQRRVLDVANRRLEHSQAVVTMEPAQSSQRRRSRILSDAAVHAGNSSDEVTIRNPDSDSNSSTIFPDPEVTREFLYQKSSEGLNEFLDPMFKQLEDLETFYARTERERARLNEQIQNYRSEKANEHVCRRRLERTLEAFRQGDRAEPCLYGSDLAEDILSNIMQAAEIGSHEWLWEVQERIRGGFTNEAQENDYVELVKALPGDESEGKARHLQRVSKLVRRSNNPTAEELDRLIQEEKMKEFYDRPLSPKSRYREDDNIPEEDQLELDGPSDSVIAIDEGVLTELLNHEALSDLHAGRDAFDQGADITADISSRTVEQLLAGAGYEVLHDEFAAGNARQSDLSSHAQVHEVTPGNAADNVALFISADDIDDDSDPGSDPMDAEPTLDPTLPHHRPNNADGGAEPITLASEIPKVTPPQRFMRWSHVNQQGTMASIEEHDQYEDPGSSYYETKLKFLIFLELYAEQSAGRGGWARLNAAEFDQILSNSKEHSLRMIGEWLNLANF